MGRKIRRIQGGTYTTHRRLPGGEIQTREVPDWPEPGSLEEELEKRGDPFASSLLVKSHEDTTPGGMSESEYRKYKAVVEGVHPAQFKKKERLR